MHIKSVYSIAAVAFLAPCAVLCETTSISKAETSSSTSSPSPEFRVNQENAVLYARLDDLSDAVRELQFWGANGYPSSLYNSYATGINPSSIWPPYGGMRPYGPGFQRGPMNQNIDGQRTGLRGSYAQPGMSGWGAAANYYSGAAPGRYLSLRNRWKYEVEPFLDHVNPAVDNSAPEEKA